MKTNHVIRAITSLVLLFVSQQVSAGVIPLSSGIKSQIYSLEWCAPHGSRVNVPSGCME